MQNSNPPSRKATARQDKKVVVFGIFDGVHDGHRDLFRQARILKCPLSTPGVDRGGELIVIVGRDESAEKLKGKKPKYTQDERVEMLKKEELVTNAVLGDAELSSYKVLEQLKPAAICVGYDQTDLEADLQKWIALRQAQGEASVKIYRAKPHKQDLLHNSYLT